MKKVNLLLIYILLALQVNVFYILPLPDSFYTLESYTSKYLSILIAVILIIINIGKLPKLLRNSRIYELTMLLFIILTICMLFYSRNLYNQTLLNTFTTAHQYFVILLFFAFYLVYPTKEMLFKIARMVIVFGTIASIILIVQAVLYSNNEILLTQNTDAFAIQAPSFLFGLPRIAVAADFVSFSILIQSVFIATNQKKITWMFAHTIINLVYIVFVAQTRMYVISDILVLLLASVFLMRKKSKQISILIGVLMLAVGIFALHPIVDQFQNGARSISYTVRVQAINFYLHEMPTQTLWGIGFPNASQDVVLHGGIINTLGYQYYLDDLGVFGFYVQFGLSSVILLIFFIIGTIKAYLNSISKISIILSVFYIMLTSISLSLLNPQRIFYFTVIVFLMSFLSIEKTNSFYHGRGKL